MMSTQPRYLITGCSGYLGSHLISALQTQQPDARIAGLSLSPSDSVAPYEQLTGDLFSPDFADILEAWQPDIVFHAVGVSRHESLRNQILLHVEGTRHLLQALVDRKLATRVVILGSAAEYGSNPEAVDENTPTYPGSDYGVAKLCQTMAAQYYSRKYHLPVMIARLFNVYGHSAEHFVIASLAAQIARTEQLTSEKHPVLNVQNLSSVRDFIHIHDVVAALIALGAHGYPGEIYNIGSGKGSKIEAVLQSLIRLSDLKKPEVLTHGDQQADYSQACIDKIKAHTGWQPHISLEQGLAEELAYWRQQLKTTDRELIR